MYLPGVRILAYRYVVLAGEIRRLCVSLRRNGQSRLPGETELCQKYSCSRQTVRKALSLLEQEGLIVRRHGSGTYISVSGRSRNKRIAVVTTFNDDYIFPHLLQDMEAVFSENGYCAECYCTENYVTKERDILLKLLNDPPSGLLLEGSKTALPSPNLDLLRRIMEKGIPLVFLNAGYPELNNVPCIQDDNVAGGVMLTRYLLNKGHKNIAAIFKSDDMQGIERYQGFLSGMRDSEHSVAERSILWYSTDDRDSLISGESDMLERFILHRLRPCTAVICYNDEIAYYLVHDLVRMQLHIPNDVAVVSFDNSYYCTASPVGVTSLGHERRKMGTAAAHALIDVINGKSARSVRLPWGIIQRGSS